MSDSSLKHKATAPKTLRFALFIVSTSRSQQLQKDEHVVDVSGDLAESLLRKAGHSIVARRIIPDEKTAIVEATRKALSLPEVDVVVLCGGTGIATSDITIETVAPLMEKTLQGFGELFRKFSFDEIGSAAVMSRAVAGVAEEKVIFCIPGSPDAVRLSFEKLILPESGHIVRHARE